MFARIRGLSFLAISILFVSSLTVSADDFGAGENQFSVEFVVISGDTNPVIGIPAGTGYTFNGVDKDYRVGVFEITREQWGKFKAELGRPLTGYPANAYNTDCYWTAPNFPATNVSWFEAAQFVNWLNTSAGYHEAYKFTGFPGQSNYTFDTWDVQEAYNETNPYRHKYALYFLPSEDEWVKAAYWNGNVLQMYSNASLRRHTGYWRSRYKQVELFPVANHTTLECRIRHTGTQRNVRHDG